MGYIKKLLARKGLREVLSSGETIESIDHLASLKEMPRIEADRMAEITRKANEVMNTGNTGYGAEYVPSEVIATEILNITPAIGHLLALLPGNHGVGLPKSGSFAAIGIRQAKFQAKKRSEWTTGRSKDAEAKHSQSKIDTPKVTITQSGFIAEVDLTDDDIRYSSVPVDELVRRSLGQAMLNTIDNLIINGDTAATANANINLIDGTPDAESNYLAANGLRKLALAGGYKVDVGTLDEADYSDVIAKLGNYSITPSDLLIVQQQAVTMKAKSIASFKLVANSGDKASIQSGLVPTPFGTDIHTSLFVDKTDATGSVSATAGNNTKGQFVAFLKAAVQYGFGQDAKLEVERVTGYGFRFVLTFDFGFTVIDAGTGLADPTVAIGYNVTI